MLKRFVSSLLAAALLAGCSSGGGVSADAAGRIVKDLGLTARMDKMDESASDGLFFFDEGTVTSSSLYLANDKSADAVGVFETKDTESTRKAIKTYLETTKAQNQSYNPEEVFKIDNAVVEDDGKTVIMVVCDDLESAKKIVKDLLKK